MGRSAKEHCRPAQACDGGGKVKPGKIVVKSEESSGMKMAKERTKNKPKAQAAPERAAPETGDYEGKSGWEKIGQAGSDIVSTYNTRKKSAG